MEYTGTIAFQGQSTPFRTHINTKQNRYGKIAVETVRKQIQVRTIFLLSMKNHTRSFLYNNFYLSVWCRYFVGATPVFLRNMFEK